MALACKICIMKSGLSGREVADLPQTEEELAEHMERVHHILVRRENETPEQAVERFAKAHPDAVNCIGCINLGAPWTKRR